MLTGHDNIRSVVYHAPKTALEFHYVIFGVSNHVASIIVSSPSTLDALDALFDAFLHKTS